jgi:hypothetical protein
MNGIDTLGFFTALLALAAFLSPARVLTGITVLLSVVQLGWLTRYAGSAPMYNRIGLVAMVLLATRLFIDILRGHIIILKADNILKYSLLLAMYVLFHTFLSNVYSGESIVLGLYNLRYYAHGLVICFALYGYYDLKVYSFVKFCVLLGIIQIPASIIKYIFAGSGFRITLDSVTGTFSSYGELVACQMFAIILVLFFKVTENRNIFRLNGYLLPIALIVPLLLSKSRAATGFILLSVLYILLVSWRKMGFRVLLRGSIPMLLILASIVMLFYYYFWLPSYDIEEQLSTGYLSRYFSRGPRIVVTSEGRMHLGMGRISQITTAISLVSKSPMTAAFGLGSGATSESIALGIQGQHYGEWGIYTGLGSTELSKIISEFGFLGAIAVLTFFFGVYRTMRLNLHHDKGILIPIFAGLCFVILALSWYTFTLSSYFMPVLFGYFLALVQQSLNSSVTS